MENKSYWIWHYGEYEIYHTMQIHLRREKQGFHIPSLWHVAVPYAVVKFRKSFTCEGGYLLCHMNGEGSVAVDGAYCQKGARVTLSPGAHSVEIVVSREGGLPAVFVESDACPSDGTWTANHCAGSFLPVGMSCHHDALEKNPEHFPFAYERITPIAVESVEGGLLYDFGRETFGYLNIGGAAAEDRLGVFYGESREEATDTAYTVLREEVVGQTDYRLRQRAFRYIYIRNSSRPLTITADYEYLPLAARGTFSSSDPLFDRIFSTAAYTFHLNCREAFLDGIKRDRWVWSGDAYQSARINRYLFADPEIEQRTLLGLIGKRPIEQHINTILDYSLLWLITLYEHYMTYGDRTFLSRIYPMAEELLAFCETRLNADGFLEGQEGDWTFIDWASIDKTGAVSAEQMLLIHAYAVMGKMAVALGRAKKGAELAEKSKTLCRRVNEYYWCAEKGAFIDSYASGKQNVTRHANIFAVMYDIASEEQKQSILHNVLKNSAIPQITTPYFEGYELDALAKLGELGAVEEKLTSYWGGMLSLGATTVWEEYHPDMQGAEHYAMYGEKYDKSLCHAWGAGPIYLFGRYYLGVSATSVGYESFTVAPRLGGLREIHGRAPVGDGSVTVDMDEKSLTVTADRAGGTLLFGGREYPLVPNEPCRITL